MSENRSRLHDRFLYKLNEMIRGGIKMVHYMEKKEWNEDWKESG
ncbi:hypothetical protein [Halobacillus litoralis]|nr:hypothetical protein [Halobacillus litoralis]